VVRVLQSDRDALLGHPQLAKESLVVKSTKDREPVLVKAERRPPVDSQSLSPWVSHSIESNASGAFWVVMRRNSQIRLARNLARTCS
jgi:hypothetical protein